MDEIKSEADTRTQRIDDVAYAIACVMVRKTMLDVLGDLSLRIEYREREIQVHRLASQLALDLRAEAVAAIEAVEITAAAA